MTTIQFCRNCGSLLLGKYCKACNTYATKDQIEALKNFYKKYVAQKDTIKDKYVAHEKDTVKEKQLNIVIPEESIIILNKKSKETSTEYQEFIINHNKDLDEEEVLGFIKYNCSNLESIYEVAEMDVDVITQRADISEKIATSLLEATQLYVSKKNDEAIREILLEQNKRQEEEVENYTEYIYQNFKSIVSEDKERLKNFLKRGYEIKDLLTVDQEELRVVLRVPIFTVKKVLIETEKYINKVVGNNGQFITPLEIPEEKIISLNGTRSGTIKHRRYIKRKRG